jgi:hypothetical protein
VKITARTWRPALRVLALALVVAAVPLPALAQEKSPPATQSGIQASLHKVVAETPMMPAKVQAARAQGSTAEPPKTPFFKSKAGYAVLAVIGVGTGYAIYSTSHDRIHSEVRKNQ